MVTSIVIPAHNEEKNIGYVIRDILSLKMIPEVVVNDHSQDKTYEIVQEYAKRSTFTKIIQIQSIRRGMGSALKEGTSEASGEIIIWMMADRSDDFKTIPRIIDKIQDGSDLVIASRYMSCGSAGDLNKIKAFLSRGYSFVCKFLFGFTIHDITNAFRGFKKGVFLKVRVDSDDFAISPEFVIKAKLNGFKLAEVPTIYSDRKAGRNNFNIFKMRLRYIPLFKYAFKYTHN